MSLRPRQIAAMIARQPTREARAQMLLQVKPEWQALVRKHVENAFEARKRNADKT